MTEGWSELAANGIINAADRVAAEWQYVAAQQTSPSVLYKPRLSADGTAWCALLGDNLQEGVAGFGDTPALAMEAFDKAFLTERTPAAIRAGMVAA